MLQIREQLLEPEHPETAEILHDFAIFQEVQGKLQEALSLYQRAFTIRQHAFGSEHPKTEDALQRHTALGKSVTQEEAAISSQDDTSLDQSGQNPYLARQTSFDAIRRCLVDATEEAGGSGLSAVPL